MDVRGRVKRAGVPVTARSPASVCWEFGMLVGLLLLMGALAGCSSTEPKPAPQETIGQPEENMAGAAEGTSAGALPVTAITFSKPDCPACMKLAPILAKLQREYAGKVRFDDVNTSVHTKAVVEFGITGTPTVIVYVNKNQFKKMLNPREQELRETLDAALEAKG